MCVPERTVQSLTFNLAYDIYVPLLREHAVEVGNLSSS